MPTDQALRDLPVNGVKGFLRSPLFAGLVLFLLAQGVVFGIAFGAMYWRVSGLVEWKWQVDATLEIFKTQGSPALKTQVEHHSKEDADKFGQLHARVKAMEEDTKHFDVMEMEHLRLTKDVEELKREKK